MTKLRVGRRKPQRSWKETRETQHKVSKAQQSRAARTRRWLMRPYRQALQEAVWS